MNLTRECQICIDLYSMLTTKPINCEVLANGLGTTTNHVRVLTRRLRIAGLLNISTGRFGGVRLPNRKVSALDVISVISRKSKDNEKKVFELSTKVSNRIRKTLEDIILTDGLEQTDG